MTELEIEQENKAIAKEYKELLRISYQTLTPEDKKSSEKRLTLPLKLTKINAANREKPISSTPLPWLKSSPPKSD